MKGVRTRVLTNPDNVQPWPALWDAMMSGVQHTPFRQIAQLLHHADDVVQYVLMLFEGKPTHVFNNDYLGPLAPHIIQAVKYGHAPIYQGRHRAPLLNTPDKAPQ